MADDQNPKLSVQCKVMAGELVYDYCWFPSMTCGSIFAFSAKDRPIQAYDGDTGKLVATFTPINHLVRI